MLAELKTIPTDSELISLIGEPEYSFWKQLCTEIDARYDMEHQWNSGGKKWMFEYKYRRGGKTLCALYAKEGGSGFMVIFGGGERDKFEEMRPCLSKRVCDIYDDATTYHDGKWVMFPLDDARLADDYISLLTIKRKPNKK